jgi:hypothetical protein
MNWAEKHKADFRKAEIFIWIAGFTAVPKIGSAFNVAKKCKGLALEATSVVR